MSPEHLFHFSEDPAIQVLRPRPESKYGRDYGEAYVWAIDEWHAPMYYLPRDCPRACFWPNNTTTDEDRERWFGGVQARMVIMIEGGWLSRIRTTEVFRYRLLGRGFVLNEPLPATGSAGEPVVPISVEPVGDLLEAIAASDVELRVAPRLMETWFRVIQTTLAWSGTRLRNAAGAQEWSPPATGGD